MTPTPQYSASGEGAPTRRRESSTTPNLKEQITKNLVLVPQVQLQALQIYGESQQQYDIFEMQTNMSKTHILYFLQNM